MFFININGDLCGYFKGTKGLRQGDPLSTNLFVVAMETFTNLLHSKFIDGTIGYHPLGRNPTVSHLAFANDVMIFFYGKLASLRGISSVLEIFCVLSGLGMNIEKTSLFLTGIKPEEVDPFFQLGFQR